MSQQAQAALHNMPWAVKRPARKFADFVQNWLSRASFTTGVRCMPSHQVCQALACAIFFSMSGFSASVRVRSPMKQS